MQTHLAHSSLDKTDAPDSTPTGPNPALLSADRTATRLEITSVDPLGGEPLGALSDHRCARDLLVYPVSGPAALKRQLDNTRAVNLRTVAEVLFVIAHASSKCQCAVDGTLDPDDCTDVGHCRGIGLADWGYTTQWQVSIEVCFQFYQDFYNDAGC